MRQATEIMVLVVMSKQEKTIAMAPMGKQGLLLLAPPPQPPPPPPPTTTTIPTTTTTTKTSLSPSLARNFVVAVDGTFVIVMDWKRV